MKTFIQKLKTSRKTQIITAVVILVVIALVVTAKITSKSKQQGSDEQGTSAETKKGSSYSAEFPNLEQRQEPLNPSEISPLSGLKCDPMENKNRRPIAVMLASDKSVRPLSGISEADMVFEMPVITASITRLMGVFVCNSPKEIGSIRSARHDYITLAKGLDAMLAHWGGSHFALDMLKNTNTVPDLDAMRNPAGAFFRKAGIPAPDNGFTSYDGLLNAAKELGYRIENHFEGYPHRQESLLNERGNPGQLTIGFAGPFRADYTYDPKTNSYLRSWDGKPDIDRSNNQRIAPKNIIVLFATSRQIEGQYNDVDIEGEGEMRAFIEGREFKGKWEKKKGNCVIGNELVCVNSAKLKFTKEDGQELEFIPGQIWVEILEPGQKLKWVQ
ncbi:DUF3048 domain-containing protein [Patescibacteria group bacterium]|nr:DUF3048 domain-containing protein [Patescibacteria group bacterium]